MPTTGYVFKDGGPIPDDELDHAGQRPNLPLGSVPPNAFESSTSSTSPSDTPTSSRSGLASTGVPSDSHALAEADHDEKGAVQHEHYEAEVKDLGWNEHAEAIPKPLVGGLPNEDLWMLVRRFNKQMYHVKATPEQPLAGLDLIVAEEEEFSPDKFRANIERLYITVIVGLIGFGKHIARLRSWREPRRTVAFATAYFIAWIFDLVLPLLITTMITLVVYPPSRSFLFPPAPLALVNSRTGGIQSPQAGVLGSHDTVTGAPEKHRGEAVEQEASNFVAGIASIVLSSASGKHEASDPASGRLTKSIPDPSDMAMAQSDAKDSASGAGSAAKHDKTKQPMEEMMWSKMRPTMRIIGEISDGWERFHNALSPTPPFPQDTPRLKLAAVLVPLLAVSLVTSAAMFVKMSYFFVGVGLFSDPLLWRAAHLLNQMFPKWRKLLELRNNILKGVPTNAQLTITLLRLGEAKKAPLPPPPRTDEAPPDEPAALNKDDLTLDASHADIHDAIHATPAEQAKAQASGPGKPKAGAKILGFVKGLARTGIDAKLGTDRVRAAAGSAHARDHLGILPTPDEANVSGPVEFRARHAGTKGWVYITTSATIPCVAFSSHVTEGAVDQPEKELRPVFSIPINDIRELKKIGGVGWKAKLVVGWATDKAVADGLEIVTKTGESWKLTAIPLREELFNRLVAMGGQKWESW